VQECPVYFLYREIARLHHHARGIDCGACDPVCPVERCLRPADNRRPKALADDTRSSSQPTCAGREAPLDSPCGAGKTGPIGVAPGPIASRNSFRRMTPEPCRSQSAHRNTRDEALHASATGTTVRSGSSCFRNGQSVWNAPEHCSPCLVPDVRTRPHGSTGPPSRQLLREHGDLPRLVHPRC